MSTNQECLDDLIDLVREETDNSWQHLDIHEITLGLLRLFHDHHDNMPNIRELAIMSDALEGKPIGTTGTNTINRRLNVLEAKGEIVREASCFSGNRRARIKFAKRD